MAKKKTELEKNVVDYNLIKELDEKLINNKMYKFQFNEKVPINELKNKTEEITGEMAKQFILSNYGVLC